MNRGIVGCVGGVADRFVWPGWQGTLGDFNVCINIERSSLLACEKIWEENTYIYIQRERGWLEESVWWLGGSEMTKEFGVGWFWIDVCAPAPPLPLSSPTAPGDSYTNFQECLAFPLAFSFPLVSFSPILLLVFSTSCFSTLPLFFSGQLYGFYGNAGAGLCILYLVCDKLTRYMCSWECGNTCVNIHTCTYIYWRVERASTLKTYVCPGVRVQ